MKYTIGDAINNGKKECCICGKKFSGYGNNPWPVCEKGTCCDECNFEVVLPARIKGMKKSVKDSIEDLTALIKSEEEAIDLYTRAIKNAGDGMEVSVYNEILKDEKDHLLKLQALASGYNNSQAID